MIKKWTLGLTQPQKLAQEARITQVHISNYQSISQPMWDFTYSNSTCPHGLAISNIGIKLESLEKGKESFSSKIAEL
ncbi:hypothetical protein P3S67_023794 [Capsicum chacoense]